MDASATNGKRKFPGYTLKQLEEIVAAGRGTPAMLDEIEARKAGRSRARVTPQIQGGIAVPRLGRM